MNVETIPTALPVDSSRGSAFLRLFFQLKVRLLNNHLSSLKKHIWIHIVLLLISMFMLIGGGTLMFRMIFSYLSDFAVFGPLLMDHLIKMVLLAFFSMLIFSNLIIMLTTTFLSREVEYLIGQPISHRSLFFGKLGESVIYSSWAFVVLAFPLFTALGQVRHLGWTFYAGTIGLLIPYLVLPAVVGASIGLLITVYFPPRQIIRFALAMLAVGLVSAVIAQRNYGLTKLLGVSADASHDDLGRLMRILSFGDLMVLPSGWFGRGLTALQHREWREAAFWAQALWSSALMGVVAVDWMAGSLYFRGWCNARSSGTARRTRRWGFYLFFDKLLFWLPRPIRALVTKDLSVFWRDPAQWSQLLILFGLLFIYVANLRSAAGMAKLESFFPGWRTMLSMFNMGATTFVLSILTTRFVFPMLSLEGKQQWVIGLAPIRRTSLVWVKFMVSWLCSTAVTLPLVLLSSFMLKTDPAVSFLTIGMVLCMSAGLSALAVGFGALMPSFNDDNPARIASGLGGTITAIVSLIYIGLSLALVTPWVQRHMGTADLTSPIMQAMLRASIPVFVVLQATTIILPMALGLRRWARIEF